MPTVWVKLDAADWLSYAIMSSPILETKRFWLQTLFPVQQGNQIGWLPAPGEELAANIPPQFASQEEAHHFEAGFHHYQKFDRGSWAILRKQDGCLLGWCGLRSDETSNETHLGFRLAPSYWRYGYSAEVANACLGFAFTNAGIDCVLATVQATQVGAVKILSQLGMNRQNAQAIARNNPATVDVYAITKEEWLSLQ